MQPAARAATNSSTRLRCGADEAITGNSTTARGARLGRVRTAAATQAPAPKALHGPGTRLIAHAVVHHAVAGMSLIGSKVWNTNNGLRATSIAAIRPVRASATRRPIRYVIQIVSPPRSGTTTYTASRPASRWAPAMNSGRPGGYVGTRASRVAAIA